MVINRLYKLVLILSIVIQLSFFFMVVTIGLWIDQLWNGQIAHLARLASVYKPVFLVVFIVSRYALIYSKKNIHPLVMIALISLVYSGTSTLSSFINSCLLILYFQGWFAVRRELRISMLAFLVLSFGYLLGWGTMFASATFRWTFVRWRFFSLMASGSALLTLIALILGLICRVNFGKGLPRYRMSLTRCSHELHN